MTASSILPKGWMVGLAKLSSSESLGGIIARSTSGAFGLDVLGYGLALAAQVLLARVMGAGSFGQYIYIVSWLNIWTLIVKLGLDSTLLRFVPAYQDREKWSLVRGILRRSDQLVLSVGFAFGGAIALTIWIFRFRFDEDLIYTAWLCCIALPFAALMGLRQASLRSLKHIVLAGLPALIGRKVAFIICIVLLVLLFPLSVDAPLAMGAFLFSTIFAFGLGTYLLWRKLPLATRGAKPDYRDREWITISLPLLLVSGTFMLTKRIDVLMVGMLVDTTEAGVYAVASRVADLAVWGLAAASAIGAPMISQAYAQGNREVLQRVVTLTGRIGLGFSLLLTLAIVVGREPVLALFGEEFTKGEILLVIIAMGQLANAATGPVGLAMSMTGQQNRLCLILSLALILHIILNFLLIPVWGSIGAALATALINALWNGAATIEVYCRLKINCFVPATLPSVTKWKATRDL